MGFHEVAVAVEIGVESLVNFFVERGAGVRFQFGQLRGERHFDVGLPEFRVGGRLGVEAKFGLRDLSEAGGAER